MIKEDKQKELGEDILNDIDVLIDVQESLEDSEVSIDVEIRLNNLKKKVVLYFQNQNKGEKK